MTTGRHHPRVLTVIALTALICSIGFADQSRKSYHNDRWGFCIAYPSAWPADEDEGSNGAGLRLTRGDVAISVGALPLSPDASGRQISLSGLVDREERTFGADFLPISVRNVRVVTKRSVVIAGIPGLRTETRYTAKGIAYVQEAVDVIKDDLAYRFQLRCKLFEAAKYTQLFDSIMSTLQWQCESEANK